MIVSHRPHEAVRDSVGRKWLLATLLTVLTFAGAQVSARLPFTPVPVTFQVFAVLLSGLLLGSRWGALAQAQYLALGFSGAPIFALGQSGVGVLFWPHVTGGYLLSYPLAAFLVGLIVERGTERNLARIFRRDFAACAVGLGVIYGLGCAWLMFISRPMLSPGAALLAGAGWFVVWDAVKALTAIMITDTLRSRRRS